ncbi:MAG: hypothetical protein UHD09_09275 [Bifidobacterium sp.]|nr:hypothetical protein [Bifidobacterium sp.]
MFTPERVYRGVLGGKHYTTRSLDKFFKDRYGKRIGQQVVLHPKQLERQGDRLCLPLYMSGLI